MVGLQLGDVAIITRCSTTLDADARLIPPRNVGDDFSGPIEVPILDPQDDDRLSSPTSHSVYSQSRSENKVLNERKQKSVANFGGRKQMF